MKKDQADNAKGRILDAAERVVTDAGARHLTLEAVAAKAGVSRGGLLYHFPDKESLLKGMLDRYTRHLEDDKKKRISKIPEGPDREAAAYVQTYLAEEDGAYRHVTASVIASSAHAPELLSSAREDCRKNLLQLTKDGLRFERAAVIMLATHGLRLMEALSVSPVNRTEKRKIAEELLALARE